MIILSCGNGNSIDTLYKHRQDLLDEFQNKSIITRGENFIALSYHNNEYVNTFYFQKLQDSFIMTNDTLEFPANQIPAFININNGDSVSLKIAVTNELNRLTTLINLYKIKSIRSKYGYVDVKLYLEDYNALLYVLNIDSVKNVYWKNYILSGKQLDRNWYYVKDQTGK
jgi:hypothetical protein